MGASVTQMAVQMFVVKNSGCLQKDVAKELSLNKSAVTGLINRMEINGLLERVASEEDARAIKLYPTVEGLKKAKELAPFIDELNGFFKQEFSDAEIETVLKFLNFILKQF